MTRKSATAFFALILGITLSTAPKAQDIKLYAFSSGALTIGKGALVNLASDGADDPGSSGILRHQASARAPSSSTPATTTRSSQTRATGAPAFTALKPVNTPDVAIDVQLQKIGLTPDDITYVVVEPPAPRPWRQRRQVPEIDARRAEERDRERLLARARDRRPLHDRRRYAAALGRTRTTPTP